MSRAAKNQVIVVTAKPVIKHDTTYTLTLIGPDTVRLVQGDTVPPLGATCRRQIDSGAITAFAPKTSGTLDTAKVGTTTLAYACEEPDGMSRAAKNQVIVVTARTVTIRTLLAAKDIHFDLWNIYQQGLTPVLGLYPEGSDQANAIAFDLTQVRPGRLIKGVIRLLTYISSEPWDTVVTWKARIRGLRRDWVEGTGNHFWHDGDWRNGGETIFRNYAFPSDLKNRSQNPISAPGVKYDSASLWMDANLDSVATVQVTAKYRPGPSVPLPIASGLTQVDLDITDYLKSADLSRNFGFYIQINGAEGYVVSCMSRELQSGAIGPKLILQEQ